MSAIYNTKETDCQLEQVIFLVSVSFHYAHVQLASMYVHIYMSAYAGKASFWGFTT